MSLRTMRKWGLRSFMAAVVLSTSICSVKGADLRALGLELSWTASVQISGDGGGVVAAELWLDRTQKRDFAVVELAESTVLVAARQLGPDLQPLGMDGAKAEVRRRASRILGQGEGFEVVERSIGQLKLVVTNSNGLIQCFDAETGKLQWATPCGDSSSPTFPAALSEAGVVVIRDDRMYLLDWMTGKQTLNKRLPGSLSTMVAAIDVRVAEKGKDSAAGLVTNSITFTSDLSGQVNSYSLTSVVPPWSTQIVGRIVGSPITLPNRSSTAITTDRGWMYVLSGSRTPSMQFRYEAGSAFGGSLAAGDNAFYMGDASGKVSKISTRATGSLEWIYRLPQSITAKPLVDVTNGLVYVSTEAGELTAIEDSTGYPAWNQIVYGTARIQAPVAICNGSVICRTFSRSLAAYDIRSGQLLGQSEPGPLSDLILTNSMTDRLYVLGVRGELSCYRPIGRMLPKISAAYDGSEIAKPGDRGSSSETAPARSTSDNWDDFDSSDSDTSSDPFEISDDMDPFSEAENPFDDNGF